MSQSTARRSADETPKVNAVVDAVRALDLPSSNWWAELDALSTHTYLDGIEVDPEGIVIKNDGSFSGVMNVYVLLKYGPDDGDAFQTTASFLASFDGHLEPSGAAIVDDVRIDTSPFFEGEERTS